MRAERKELVRRMNKLIAAGLLVLMAVATGCAYSQSGSNDPVRPSTEDHPKCDIDAYIDKFESEPERVCVAKLVAKRCNEADACQFRCQLSGEWDEVIGGCDHMCNYGEAFLLPKGVELCNQRTAEEAKR
jgi:hypothetical protein